MVVVFQASKHCIKVIASISKVRVHRGFKPLDETIIRSRNGIKQSI